MRASSLLLAAAVLFGAATSFAHDYRLGEIAVGHPWTRAAPPAARTAAGFLTLANEGQSADRLVGASSPVAARVEIHEMKTADGVMQMRRLPEGIELPPGETVTLEPGGLHLMLLELTGSVTQGERVPVTLEFEKAGTIEVELAVTAPGGDAHQHSGTE